jgi:uncharacterized protein involved in outer membrane biogenesis
VDLSAQGLAARGRGEEAFLDPLRASLASGRVQADAHLDRVAAAGGDVAVLYGATTL